MTTLPATPGAPPSRLDLGLAALLACAAAALYIASLPPSFAYWDTGELQTVAIVLGIAHPPACPAFVLLGWLFAHGLPFGNQAWRVDLMCALASASASGVLFLTMRRLGLPALISLAAGGGFAYAAEVWRFATRAEVHDLALLFCGLALYFAIAFAQTGTRRDAFCCALAWGFAEATHGVALLLLPALAVAVSGRREVRDPRIAGLALGGIALGLLPYAYIPFRSAYLFSHHVDPTLSLGLPPGLPFWDYDHPSNLQNFWHMITGADFHVGSGFRGYVNVLRYLDYGNALVQQIGGAFGIPGLIAVAIGCVALPLGYGRPGIAIVVAGIARVPYIQSYSDLQDPDRYYLLSLWCAAIALAAGFEITMHLLKLPKLGLLRSAFAATIVAAFAIVNGRVPELFGQRNDADAAAYVERIKSLTPDDAVVLSNWAFSTPLAYAAYVDGDFGHRIVVPASSDQYASYYDGWLREGRPLYFVSFSPDERVDRFVFHPVFEESRYAVYQIGK